MNYTHGLLFGRRDFEERFQRWEHRMRFRNMRRYDDLRYLDDDILEYLCRVHPETTSIAGPHSQDSNSNIASTADDERLKILDAVGRAKALKLCLRRIWAVASSLPNRENSLPGLIPVPGTFVIPGHDRERHEHEQCTFDFCEQSRVDFTSVEQHHETPCEGKCEHFTFPLQLLSERVRNREPTAWRLDEPSLLDGSRPYMAISHVWSDGTGSGIWGPGKVNKCLYTFFCKIARGFQCEGCWWDSISIPLDDETRTKALSGMHTNYNNSRITLVHDLYLREWEWVDPETACFAIVMSPWYSRGWTALELAQSHKVKILFKAKNDNYVIKDLDVDILAKVPEGHATADAIRKLRNASIDEFGTLLAILGARDTSKPRDVPIISGLLAGVDVSGGLSQQDIYQRILRKLGKVSQGHLFHNSATMSAPGFSWCPTNILDMPMAEDNSATLTLHENGDLEGVWKVQEIGSIKVENLITRGTHPLTQVSLESAFRGDNPKKHVLLLEINEQKATNQDRRALLVKLKENKGSDEIVAKFVGPIYYRADQAVAKQLQIKVRIGSTEELNDVSGEAWEYVEGKTKEKASTMEETPGTGRGQRTTKPDALPSSDDASNRDSPDWRAILFRQGIPKQSLLGDKSRIPPITESSQSKSQDQMAMFFCCDHIPGPEKDLSDDNPRLEKSPCAFFYGHEGLVNKVKTWLGENAEPTNGQTMVLALGKNKKVEAILAEEQVAEELLAEALLLATANSMERVINTEALVTLLLDIKAPHHYDGSGRTPLHIALEGHNYPVVRTLLHNESSSASVNLELGDTRQTALHLAAKDLKTPDDVSDLLIQKSNNADAQDKSSKRTALHYAAESGNVRMIRKLLKKPVSLNIRDSESQVALHCAAYQGSDEIVQLLLEHAEKRSSGSDSKEAVDTCNVPSGPTDISTGGDTNGVTGDDSGEESDDATDDTVDGTILGIDGTSSKDVPYSGLPQHEEHSYSDSTDSQGQTPLHLAAKAGHNSVVAALLKSGTNVHAETKTKETALILAAKHGHTEIVKTLLEVKDEGYEQAELNGALLMAAVGDYEVGDYKRVITELYNNGARSSGSCISDGMTALHWTIQKRNRECAETLIQSREVSDIDVTDKTKKQPALLMAAGKGMSLIVTSLLEKGANINLVDSDERTALHLATQELHETTVEVLLNEKFKCPVNRQDYQKRTALHWAALRESESITKLIVGNRYHQDIADKDGRTALDIASEQGLDTVVDILLKGGSSPTHAKYTTLERAATLGHKAVVEKLLPKVVSPDHRKSALQLAAKAGNLSVAILLHKSIEEITVKTSTLQTILIAAAAKPEDSAIDEVLNPRIDPKIQTLTDPNIKDDMGRPLLLLAIENGHQRLVKYLFSSQLERLKTDLQDKEGRNALMVAVIENDASMVRRLGYYGTVPDLADKRGYTALHYAVEDGCFDCFIELLNFYDASLETIQDGQKRTALHIALEKIRQWSSTMPVKSKRRQPPKMGVYMRICARLVRYGKSLGLQDKNGRNALHLAVAHGLEPIVNIILRSSVSESSHYLDTEDGEGQTPLLLAAAKGYPLLVKLLLSCSFTPDTKDKNDQTPLLLTAERGDTESVEALLDRDADPNLQDKHGRTALSQAAQNGHVDVVDCLLHDRHTNHKINLNTTDSMGRTALILATENGHENVVDSLLRDRNNNHKIDLNARDSMGRTALILATENGRNGIVDSLLHYRGNDHKTNLNIRDNMGRTALILAAENGHDNIVETLVRNKANSDVVGNDGKKAWQKAVDKGRASVVQKLLSNVPIQDRQAVNEALLLASKRGWADLVKVLLQQEVDLTFQSSGDKWTALHMAAMSGHRDVLSMLIQKGVDIVIKDRRGRTALFQATEQGFESIVEILLKRKEIKNDIDAWMGKESLLFAAEKGYDGIVEHLLGNGVNCNATDASGKTAMALAAANGKESIVKMLLRRRARWAIKDKNERTALHHAAWGGYHNIVETLLASEPRVVEDSRVVDSNVVDNGGHSALHLAAERASFETVDKLLDKRPNVNARCKDGQTVLHRAAWGGSLEVVKLLRKSGADPFIRDNQNKKPWHVAAEKGHETISVELLQEEENVYDERIKDEKALIFAAKMGHTSIACCLLQKNAEATVKDQDGRTPLHWAASRDDKELTKLLIGHRDVSINAVDHDGRTALCLAVLYGSTAAVEILLQSRLNANVPDAQGQTALHHAAQRGNEEIAQMLVDHNADPHIHDKYRRKAWQLAAEKGHHQVVRLLLKKEIELDTHNERRKELFWKMSEQDRAPMVQLLLDLGVDKDAKDRFGRTAIGLAAERGSDDVLRLLLFKGANFSTPDLRRQTPLLWAAKAGNAKIISLLLDKIINQSELDEEEDTVSEEVAVNTVDHQDAEGRTALVVAIENKHDKAVKLLLDKCEKLIDVNIKDKMQRTALQLAAEMGNINWVQLLLRNHADQQHKDRLERTALLLAAEQGHTEVVKVLLENSKEYVNFADNQGRTPLQAATDCGDRDMVVALLGADADPLKSDGRSRTALLLAVEHGDKFIVDLLLQRNAAQDADRDGRTPLLLAVANGDKAIVEALLNHSDVDPNVERDKAIVEALLKHCDTGSNVERNKAVVQAPPHHSDAELNAKSDEAIVEAPLNHSDAEPNAESDEAIVEEPLNHSDAGPNAKNAPNKRSLLHLAVDSGNKDVAWLLLKMVMSRNNAKQKGEVII